MAQFGQIVNLKCNYFASWLLTVNFSRQAARIFKIDFQLIGNMLQFKKNKIRKLNAQLFSSPEPKAPGELIV